MHLPTSHPCQHPPSTPDGNLVAAGAAVGSGSSCDVAAHEPGVLGAEGNAVRLQDSKRTQEAAASVAASSYLAQQSYYIAAHNSAAQAPQRT